MSSIATSSGRRSTTRQSRSRLVSTLGKKIEKIIRQLEYKRDVNKEYYIGDKIYTQNKSISTIKIEKAKWSVTVVTDKIVKERVY